MAADPSDKQDVTISSSAENAESSSGANNEEFFDVCEPVDIAVEPQLTGHALAVTPTQFSLFFRADQGHTDILEFQNQKTPEGNSSLNCTLRDLLKIPIPQKYLVSVSNMRLGCSS
jgi:hypothetical protein